ncbi:hypothetical protein FOF71_05475 [Lactobacillus paragasseri]|uniref:Uncharacterized protein n=1 Tax=Lactobacillus paragasseri TaxID=2107999 RepID=A0AAW6XNL2_9LACO|nr:hypothetical protein [Lactobacillus paragasseri]MDK6868394.1 hypothetical protein [Lactobacillus paragasseri]TVV00036.1 hypothetical protein FOF71_05475 [Lactobacillus paragasseri]
MSIIDLDKRIKVDNKVDVKLAGKTYKILFDDNFQKTVAKSSVEFMNGLKALDDPSWADKDMAIQKKDVENTFNSVKASAISALDKLLGSGEGKRLYKYYNYSTDALGAVLNALNDEATKSVEVKEKKRKALKHMSTPSTVSAGASMRA